MYITTNAETMKSTQLMRGEILSSFNSRNVFHIWTQLKKNISHIDELKNPSAVNQSSVARDLRQLDCLLRVVPGYLPTGNKFVPQIQNNIYWQWQPLLEDDVLRAGVLTVNSNLPVPLHDHAGYGALLVLHGAVHVKQYGINSAYKNSNCALVVLERSKEGVFYKGDVSIVTPIFGNIHSLSVSEGYCSLLSVQQKLCENQDRSWYFPVPLSIDDIYLLANRIKTSPCSAIDL